MVTVLMVQHLFHVQLEHGLTSLVSNLSLNVTTVLKDLFVKTKTYHTLFSLTSLLVQKSSIVRQVPMLALFVQSVSHVLLGLQYQWNVHHIIIKMHQMAPSNVNRVKLNGIVLIVPRKITVKQLFVDLKKSHVRMATTVQRLMVPPLEAVFPALSVHLVVLME